MAHTVHQIAERVGLPSSTIRYYDQIGLVSPGGRSEAGYRLYGPADEGKLRFVRQAKALGISLDDIRALVAAAERAGCREVIPALDRLLDDKLVEIDARIGELGSLRERLLAYRAGRRSGCGCNGHGAFCGCLDDVPLLHIQGGNNGF